ncbi:MAG: hypothetical protein ACOZCL_00985 [Bacillota bacterium]
MFKLILDKFEKIDERFDSIDERFNKVDERFDKFDLRMDCLENEVKELRLELKDGIKGLDGKMHFIYNMLSSDINELKTNPKSRYSIIKED